MLNYNSGIYKLKTILNSELIWHKDNSSAIPFNYDHSQLFFNQIDKIALTTNPLDLQPSLIFMISLYKKDDKLHADFGYWELLMILILLSMLGEKLSNPENRNIIQKQYLTINNISRLNWRHIDDFYQNELLNFNLFTFCKKSDDQLNDVEKVLREVVEAVWEYTNCITISNDEEIMDFINKLIEFSHIMVVFGENPDQSLSVAANMYGSYKQLLQTDLKTLSPDWEFF